MSGGDLFTQEQLSSEEAKFYVTLSGSFFDSEKEELRSLNLFESNEYYSDIFLIKDGGDYSFSFDNINKERLNSLSCLEDIIEILKYRRVTFRGKRENVENGEQFWKYYNSFSSVNTSSSSLEDEISRIVKKSEIKDNFNIIQASEEDLVLRPLKEKEYVINSTVNYLLSPKSEEGEHEHIISALRAYICDFSEIDDPSITKDEREFSILSLLDLPCVLINQRGNIVLHNDQFLRLEVLPRQLIEGKDEGWLEQGNKVYKIVTSMINERETLYLLIEQEESTSSIEGQSELGIISGSIAHELNNPIAGILAALTLLDLEDWDVENQNLLKELKESAIRCKGLVETFLGFSKYKRGNPIIKRLVIALDQAVALLRYRMVESGVTLQLEIEDSVKEQYVKSSALPMVFYLIYNELITILSHQQLINPGLGKNVDVEVCIEDEELIIKLNNLSLSNKEKNDLEKKLITHLIEMEGGSYSVSEKNITISGVVEK